MIPDTELTNPNQNADKFANELWGKLFPDNTNSMPAQFATLIENWAHWEGSAALNNPMDTELPMVGSTDYNSVGVKNYPSMEDGVQATIDTIRNGAYSYLETCMKVIGTKAVDSTWLANLIHDINIWGTGNPQSYFPWTKDMLATPSKYIESFGGTVETPIESTSAPTNSQLESYDNALNSVFWELANALAIWAEDVATATDKFNASIAQWRVKPS